MADLTQSSATTATTTPQYYTDYISNLASKGTQYGVGGANAPAFADATPLQQAAFTGVANQAGTYAPALEAAATSLGKAYNTDITGAVNPYLTSGTSSSADLVNDYMNPYTSNVVDKIRLANQQNIQQNLSPGITGGAVGSGQFGSQRGANALALGISNADIGALAQQAAALQSGYSDALKAAQAQRANQMQAAQMAGNAYTQQAQNYRDVGTQAMNLAQQKQTQSLADINAMATLGAQQQQIAQNKQLFPLDVLAKQAGVLSGAQIPTTQTQTMTGSPLSAIAGLGTLGIGMFTKNASGTTPWDNIKSIFGGSNVGRDPITGSLLPGYVLDTSGQPTLIPGNTGTGLDVRTGSGFQGTQNVGGGTPVGTVGGETYNPYAQSPFDWRQYSQPTVPSSDTSSEPFIRED
jgi:hypothetical protein